MNFLRKNLDQSIPILLAISNLFIWSAVFALSQKEEVKVYFLDVGQGDAILIEGRNGNQILIDGGPAGKVLEELGRVMPYFDRSIDVLIETHPDSDHIGGFPEVMERYEIGVFIEPGVNADNSVDDEIRRRVSDMGIANFIARRGMEVNLGDGSYLEVLFPDRDVSGVDTNDASIVAKYVYGDTCFILTGDSPQKIEDYLKSKFGDNLDCEVLKVGHHGSNTSTGSNFLSVVSPMYAVISAGRGNSYGHPHPEVVERLTNFGAKVLSTAGEGTIKLTSDGFVVKSD